MFLKSGKIWVPKQFARQKTLLSNNQYFLQVCILYSIIKANSLIMCLCSICFMNLLAALILPRTSIKSFWHFNYACNLPSHESYRTFTRKSALVWYGLLVLYKLVQLGNFGTGWYTLVQVGTGWCRLVQVGKCWNRLVTLVQVGIYSSQFRLILRSKYKILI